MSYFKTEFDLLTTLEPAQAQRLRRVQLLEKVLRRKTCFIGTTITEYTPLPVGLEPKELLDSALAVGSDCQLTIIKDVPVESPLLPSVDNQYACELSRVAQKRGFIALEGQALAYVDINFASLEQYLKRLSAARRKDLRRKMRKRDRLVVKTCELGAATLCDSGVQDTFYEMYLAVYNHSEIHFDLLSVEFFRQILTGKYGEGVAVLYYCDDQLVGWNISLIHNNSLIDKYIGFKYPQARELNLYFISWMYNLQYALDNKLTTYIAGWTDPEVKAALGASFTFTRHLVHIKNPLLRSALLPFKRFFESDKNVVEAL